MARVDGPFNVWAKVGASAYRLEFLCDVIVLAIFNVGDLSPYVKVDINFGDLRENPLKGWEDDVYQCLE